MLGSELAVFFVLLLLDQARKAGTAVLTPALPRSPGLPAPAPAPSSPTNPVRPTNVSPAPFPQVVPAGLPPFPGPGWVVDTPPPAEVQARASQLLQPLWSAGPGTHKTEKTGARFITYQAALTKRGDGSTTKGVIAFRLASDGPSTAPVPVVSPATGNVVPAVAPSGHPTVRRGSVGPDVVSVQTALGIPADGKFGPGTEAAVRAFQAQHGLAVDGIVGPQTWAAILAAHGASA